MRLLGFILLFVGLPISAATKVSLHYDDALLSQLDVAAPQLQKFGFKGTFYLSLHKQSFHGHLERWRALAKAGHELGNHSLFHQCNSEGGRKKWVKPHLDLATTTKQVLVQEVALANHFLQALDGQTTRTFTPPCFDTQASDGDYYPEIKHLFSAVKTKQNRDVKEVFLAPVGQSGDELIAFIQKHEQQNDLISFTFHGVGGDYLSVTADAHHQLLLYLSKHPEKYIVDSYNNLFTKYK